MHGWIQPSFRFIIVIVSVLVGFATSHFLHGGSGVAGPRLTSTVARRFFSGRFIRSSGQRRAARGGRGSGAGRRRL